MRMMRSGLGWQDDRASTLGMGNDRDVQSIDRGDPVRGQHRLRRSVHEDASLTHQRDLIAIRGREIEIVEDAQNRQIVLPGEAQREIEDG